MRLQTCYLICTTNRTGGFFLCEGLINTGLAGRPQEHFWHPDWNANSGASTYADHLAKVIEQGTTVNGVFGAKVLWGYFNELANGLRQIPNFEGLAPAHLLSTAFPNLHYIWLRRRDKVRQGVSFAKMIQSFRWTLHSDETPPPDEEFMFDFELIDYLIQLTEAHEAAWQSYFEVAEIQPLTIIYEELLQKYEETVVQILHYLGVQIPKNRVLGPPQLRRQADALSQEWVKRYNHLKEVEET